MHPRTGFLGQEVTGSNGVVTSLYRVPRQKVSDYQTAPESVPNLLLARWLLTRNTSRVPWGLPIRMSPDGRSTHSMMAQPPENTANPKGLRPRMTAKLLCRRWDGSCKAQPCHRYGTFVAAVRRLLKFADQDGRERGGRFAPAGRTLPPALFGTFAYTLGN